MTFKHAMLISFTDQASSSEVSKEMTLEEVVSNGNKKSIKN